MDLELDNLKELIVIGAGTGEKSLINTFFKIAQEFRGLLALFKIFGWCVILDLLLEGGEPVFDADVHKIKSGCEILRKLGFSRSGLSNH